MTNAPTIALLQAQTLPTDAGAAEWVHLLPAGVIRTQDGRGPYRVADADNLIATSLQAGKLPIDENHATDLAAPRGEPSPARGWIVELQARADGIWGRVEWTPTGLALLADRAYRALSPVIAHAADGTVMGILRASLVNRPNLRGLTALHQEDPMSLMQRLAALFGLDATTATEDALVTRVTALHPAAPQATALQSQLAEIGTALGVPSDAQPDAILAAARARNGATDATVALQAELATVTGQLNQLREASARSRAESFVDGEIKRGRVGVKPLRDHYIAMHMQDAARVEKELGALPILGAGGALTTPSVPPDGTVALNAEQLHVAQMLGIDPKAVAAQLQAEHKEAR